MAKKGINEESFSSKVSLNMITNILRAAVMALVGIAMVPYYIDQFGIGTYAIIPLVTSLTTYVQIASDSLGESFARFLILAIHDGNEAETNKTYSSSVIGMFKLMMIFLPVIVILSLISPMVFSTGNAVDSDVQIMFFMVLLSSLLMSFITCLNSVFMAYNYLYVIYVFRIVHTLLQVGLVLLFFITEGPSMILLGLSFLISAMALVIGLFCGVKKINPELKVTRTGYDGKLVVEMSKLGIWNMVARLGELLFIQASIIVVNISLGSDIQGEFSIAANMISIVYTVCSSISAVSVPLIYKYYNDENEGMMQSTLRIFTKFTGLIMVFPLAYLCIFAPQILNVWLSDDYPNVVKMMMLTIPVCLTKCVFNILGSVPVIYAKLRPVSISTCIIGAMNILMMIAFLSFTDTGVYGVCVAWSISMLALDAVYYPIFISKLTGIKIIKFYKPLFLNYIIFGAFILLGILLNHYYTLPSTWLALITTSVIGFLIFMIALFRIGLNKEEKKIISSYFPKSIRHLIVGNIEI